MKLNLKLIHKIFLILLTCLSAMFMISFLTNHVIIKKYNQLLINEITKNMEVSSKTLVDISQDIRYNANQLSSSKDLQSYLRNRKNQQNTPSDYTRIYNLLSNTYFSNNNSSYMKYIDILDQDFTIGTYTSIFDHTSEQSKLSMIEKAKEYRGSCYFYTDTDITSDILCIKSIREIDMLTLDNLGTLVIGIDLDKMLNAVSSKNNRNDMIQILTNKNGELIFISDELLPITESALSLFSTPSSSVIKINKFSYLYVSIYLPENEWNYTALVPYDPIISLEVLYLTTFILILGFSLILLFFVSIKIIKKIFRNFDDLVIHMKNGKVEFDLTNESRNEMLSRSDEIGDIYRQFHQMTEQINQLIYDNYEIQLKAKNYQIEALSAQISPHFLYNTLDSINWKAKSANVTYISEMVESLGKILQLTLNNPAYFFSLDEELLVANYYLNIQKIRYKDTLNFQFEVDDLMRECLVPRLILQPLIENAIQESMSYLDGRCHLMILIQSFGENVRLKISNTGSCFDDDFTIKFNTDSILPRGFGIGLKNIEQRLRLCYAHRFILNFYNERKCAVVEIIVPQQRKDMNTTC